MSQLYYIINTLKPIEKKKYASRILILEVVTPLDKIGKKCFTHDDI